MERVVKIHEREETEEWPSFCDEGGYLLTEKFVEEEFLHPILEILQASGWGNGAIPKGLAMRSSHRCFRLLRKGASITVTNKGVKEMTINFVCCWDKYEMKRGKQPSFDMIQHYMDGNNTTHPLQICYSSSV